MLAFNPAIAIHLSCAVTALALGPVALWARKGSRPHRAAGYAWVTVMLGAAISCLFIRDVHLPNVLGYTPIHLFAVFTFVGLSQGIWHIAHRNINAHRRAMQRLYYGACLGAGAFALLPSRFLGNWLWHQTLGFV
jgi:uncharacterized membrane protein